MKNHRKGLARCVVMPDPKMRVLLHTQGIVSQVEAWRSKMKYVKFGLAENTKAEIHAPRTNVTP